MHPTFPAGSTERFPRLSQCRPTDSPPTSFNLKKLSNHRFFPSANGLPSELPSLPGTDHTIPWIGKRGKNNGNRSWFPNPGFFLAEPAGTLELRFMQ